MERIDKIEDTRVVRTELPDCLPRSSQKVPRNAKIRILTEEYPTLQQFDEKNSPKILQIGGKAAKICVHFLAKNRHFWSLCRVSNWDIVCLLTNDAISRILSCSAPLTIETCDSCIVLNSPPKLPFVLSSKKVAEKNGSIVAYKTDKKICINQCNLPQILEIVNRVSSLGISVKIQNYQKCPFLEILQSEVGLRCYGQWAYLGSSMTNRNTETTHSIYFL